MPVEGVRIKHPIQRNVRFTVTDPNIQYSRPYQCTPPEYGGCGQVHTHKTHHLNLDDTGSVIVERVLFEKIKAYLIAFGFTIENTVARPPALGIGLGAQTPGRGAWGNIPIVRGGEK